MNKFLFDALARAANWGTDRLNTPQRALPTAGPGQPTHGWRSRCSAFLPEALNDPDGGGEAAEATRSLIGDVILKLGRSADGWASSTSPEVIKIKRVGEIRTNMVARPGFEPTGGQFKRTGDRA
jgi:hypothetical protein